MRRRKAASAEETDLVHVGEQQDEKIGTGLNWTSPGEGTSFLLSDFSAIGHLM
jgi:hypothetical protein